MGNRRRLLIIARGLPEPAHDGYRIRVRHMLAGLAARHDVMLLAQGGSEGPPTEAAAAAMRDAGIEWQMVGRRSELPCGVRRLRAELTVRPSLFRPADSHELAGAVLDLTHRSRFDLIQLEGSEFASLPLPPLVPVLVDEHNIWSELIGRRARLSGRALNRLAAAVEVRRLRRAEHKSWTQAAGVAFTSDREADMARRRIPGLRCAVVPNGVDVDYFRPANDQSDARSAHLLFVGLLSYTPNVDAVLWFARDVLPRVQAAYPAARFDVVGREPRAELQAISGRAVRLVGPVPDVRPHLLEADVVVVPLRAGSGTRLKILEALAMGKAVVSTTLGCEGLDLRDGEHLVVADEPVEMAARVVELLDRPAKRAELGVRGRDYVVRHNAWPFVVERLEAFHDEVLTEWAVRA